MNECWMPQGGYNQGYNQGFRGGRGGQRGRGYFGGRGELGCFLAAAAGQAGSGCPFAQLGPFGRLLRLLVERREGKRMDTRFLTNIPKPVAAMMPLPGKLTAHTLLGGYRLQGAATSTIGGRGAGGGGAPAAARRSRSRCRPTWSCWRSSRVTPRRYCCGTASMLRLVLFGTAWRMGSFMDSAASAARCGSARSAPPRRRSRVGTRVAICERRAGAAALRAVGLSSIGSQGGGRPRLGVCVPIGARAPSRQAL